MCMCTCVCLCVCVQNHIEECLDDAIHVLRHHAEAGQHMPYGIAAESVTRTPGITHAGVFSPSLVSGIYCTVSGISKVHLK